MKNHILTITSDINLAGRLRYVSDTDLVPSVQFDTITERGNFYLVFVPNTSRTSRIIIEMLYLISQGEVTEKLLEWFLNSLENITENQLRQHVKTIRRVYLNIDNAKDMPLNISNELLLQTLKVLSSFYVPVIQVGGKELLSESLIQVNDFEDIDMDVLMWTTSRPFRKYLNERSDKSDALLVGRLAFYKEDHLFDTEFLSLATVNAMTGNSFDNFQSLADLYESREYFRNNRDLFQRTTCECGAELVIRYNGEDTTLIQCINFFCFEKMAHSFSDLSKHFKVVGLGPITAFEAAKATSLIKLAETGTSKIDYSDLFDTDNVKGLTQTNHNSWVYLVNCIQEFNGSLKDLIKIVSLPYIGGDASRILTLDVLGDTELTASKLLRICRAEGKYDRKFVLYLWFYMHSIRNIVFLARNSLDLVERQEIPIYITNGVRLQQDNGIEKSMTKSAFLELANNYLTNELNKPHLKVVLQSGVTQKSYALIADQGTSTSSADKAFDYHVPIVTSREFLNMLGGYVG